MMPRSFYWLNFTQFLGALNDNIFKLLLIFFLIDHQGKDQASQIVSIAGIIFVIPFLIFSHIGGLWADRKDKKQIITLLKKLEIIIMIIGFICFISQNTIGLYFTLFLMGIHSALFSPAKYSIIPEIVDSEKISQANGQLVSLTYVAIVLGSALAPLLSTISDHYFIIPSLATIFIAILGYRFSLRIKYSTIQSSQAQHSFFKEIFESLPHIWHDKYLLFCILANAYFLFIGSFLQLNMIPYGIHHLNISTESSSYLFLLAAIGIGLGGLWVGKISGKSIELGFSLIGLILLGSGCFLLAIMPSTLLIIYIILFAIGISSALVVVPVDAYMQYHSPANQRGKIISTANFLSWISVLISSVLIYIFTKANISAQKGFLIIGLFTSVMLCLSLLTFPRLLLYVLSVAVRFFYKVDFKTHADQSHSAIIFSANHTSWKDLFLLAGLLPRNTEFILDEQTYQTPGISLLFKILPLHSINSQQPQINQKIRNAIEQERPLCCLIKNAWTYTDIASHLKLIQNFIHQKNYHIQPIYIGKVLIPLQRIISFAIYFSQSHEISTNASKLRQIMIELASDHAVEQSKQFPSLGLFFIKQSRRNWNQSIFSDTSGKNLTFGKSLIIGLLFAHFLKKYAKEERYIGILLPQSVGGIIANLAVTLSGKIAVNLNYSLPQETMQSAIRQCKIKTILSSQIFLNRLESITAPEGTVYLEKIIPEFTHLKKAIAFLIAKWAPKIFFNKIYSTPSQELASIIFSSGSTAEPKGIMLSHANILSNVLSLNLIFDLQKQDKLCGILPFFHSFGYTATIWFPIYENMPVIFHPNPLDTAKIIELIQIHKPTLLFATPSFLQSYMRKAEKDDFSSLRFIITGAEKLPRALRIAWHDKFGSELLEGYGATELSPVATLNLPHKEVDGVYKAGAKPDSIGTLIPGIAAKIVHPETKKPLPYNEAGMLMIKGPNVMQGYLNKPKDTLESMENNWYITGDIAQMDENSFITITDRLSRFSKIGGEMISHQAIEDVFYKYLQTHETILVVTSVPDPRKGEKLIVFFTKDAGDNEKLIQIMEESHLPNLWKPHKNAYFKIDQIPILGSGKLNLQAIKKTALEILQTTPNC